MATNITFTSLTADVQNYLERGGSALTDGTVYNQIPRLINAAERNLIQYLKLLGQIEVLVDPTGLTAGVPIVTKPDRWRATVSMNYGTGSDQNSRVFMFPRSYEYCRYYWPDDSVTNPPEFYADYDQTHWLVAGTPDQNYPLESLCYMQPILLDSGNQTNFWTEYTGNALLYATLVESAPFLKDDGRLQLWQSMLNQQLQTLGAQDLQRAMDRAAQRKTV